MEGLSLGDGVRHKKLVVETRGRGGGTQEVAGGATQPLRAAGLRGQLAIALFAALPSS